MTFRRVSIAAALLALGGAWLLAPPSQALSLQPLNVSDLVRESTQIVRGTVTAVNEGMDLNHLPYTEIQVRVSETIRGASMATLTFRQFGLQTPQSAENGRRYVGLVAGMPRYAEGDNVLLFLGPVSAIGYRTTVGLGQGRFALRGGNFQNDFNNAGLFKNVTYGKPALSDREKSMVATEQGAVRADAFVGLVRQAVSGKWWDAPAAKIVRPGARAPKRLATTPAELEGGQPNE
jgi:hypothetical protein